MEHIGSAGGRGVPGFDGDWQKLYRTMQENGKIINPGLTGVKGKNSFECSKKDRYVCIEFGVGGDENMDVKLAPCSRKFIPANGMEGTRLLDQGEGKRVYFFKVDAPYIPDGAEAELHYAGAGGLGGIRGGLPLAAEIGEETRPRRGRLVQGILALAAIDADGAGVDQDGGAMPGPPHGLYEALGGPDAALRQDRLPGRAPSAICDAFPRQVDHCGSILEQLGKILPGPDFGPFREAGPIGMAAQHPNPGGARQKRLHEPRSHEARSSRDDDSAVLRIAHGFSLNPSMSVGCRLGACLVTKSCPR